MIRKLKPGKRLCSLFLSLCMVFSLCAVMPVEAKAVKTTSDGWWYTLSEDETVIIERYEGTVSGELTIPDIIEGKKVTGIGEEAFGNSMSSITISAGVTSIEKNAFDCCSSLTSINVAEGSETYASVDGILYNKDETKLIRCPRGKTGTVAIPMGVTSIGKNAFDYCIGLTSINVAEGSETYASVDGILYNEAKTELIRCPEGKTGTVAIPMGVTNIGDYAFAYCSGLSSITILAGVTSIGEAAFADCRSLSSITIPAGVTSIGKNAFNYCSSLTSINVAEASESYVSVDGILYNKAKTKLIRCPGGKTGTVAIPMGVTSIGEGAFWGCRSLTDITIPAGVASIGEFAFVDCSSLTDITIPEGVTSIGEFAVAYCSSLSSVTLPASLTSIGEIAFYCCGGLNSITIPAGVTSIEKNAFDFCSSLTSINVAEGSETYASVDGILYNKAKTELIRCPEGKTGTVAIPAGVTSIGKSAFWACDSLSSVTLPASLTSIGEAAFVGCSSLTDITIPEGVTSIGEYAFGHCSSLSSVTLPASLTRIGKDAFYGCSDELILYLSCDGSSAVAKYAEENGLTYQYQQHNYSSTTTTPAKNANGKTQNGKHIQKCSVCGGTTTTVIYAPSKITLAKTSYNYDGKVKTPKVTVKDSQGKQLKENTDYSVSYAKGRKNIGSYAVTVTFKGNYTGSVKKTFKIEAKKNAAFTSGNYKYKVTGTSTVAFTGLKNSKTKKVTIPKTVKYGGKTFDVTSVADKALKKNATMTTVTIGDNVKTIGASAFEGCKKLNTITIKSTKLKTVGSNALKGIKSTAKIKVPAKKLSAYKKLLKGKGQGKKVAIKK